MAFAIAIPLSAAQANKLRVLYSFTGAQEGGNPNAGLIVDDAGNFYSTTTYGGDANCNGGSGCGTVFKVAPDGTETVLHAFAGGGDGEFSYSDLLRTGEGKLYGTTLYGGDPNCNCGTVFKIKPDGSEIVLHSFTGGVDGSAASGGLIEDKDRNLYGVTEYGGTNGQGTIYTVKKK